MTKPLREGLATTESVKKAAGATTGLMPEVAQGRIESLSWDAEAETDFEREVVGVEIG